jgi:hypothetical protein
MPDRIQLDHEKFTAENIVSLVGEPTSFDRLGDPNQREPDITRGLALQDQQIVFVTFFHPDGCVGNERANSFRSSSSPSKLIISSMVSGYFGPDLKLRLLQLCVLTVMWCITTDRLQPSRHSLRITCREIETSSISKVATHLAVLQGMSNEPRPRYQPRLNILGCFALLHGLRTGKPQIPSTIRRD